MMNCALYSLNKEHESIWDYPIPPKIEDTSHTIHVIFNGVLIAKTNKAKRVLETGRPPEYYIPPEDIRMEYLTPGEIVDRCKWKGKLQYVRIEVAGKVRENAAWYFPETAQDYVELENYLSFHPHLVDGCYVNGEKVAPEPDPPYRGWITKDIIGPFLAIPKGIIING